MQNLQPPRTVLDAGAVARRLGVDPATVYRMAADGRLPGVRVGRQWRFAEADVEHALRHGVPPAPAAPTDAVTTLAVAGCAAPRASEAAVPAAVGAPAWPDPEALHAVVEFAAGALGVMMVVTDMQGRPLVPVANPCPAFAERARRPEVVAACVREWRDLAADLTFEPRFSPGALGFECARALIRSGDRLVGAVLVGGVAPRGADRCASDAVDAVDAEGWTVLDDERRAWVLRHLVRLAGALSRLAGHPPVRSPDEGGAS